MKTKRGSLDMFLMAVAAVGLVIGAAILLRPQSEPPKRASQESGKPVVKTPPVTAAPSTPAPAPASLAEPVKPKAKSGKKGPILDPQARVALKRVGSDPDSEQYWISAINNPLLPAEERQDLIEDLNEDGLSDIKNPGVIDLPLIHARLSLIDRLMPSAMDKVNADAFQEARKDLTNMLKKYGEK